MKCIIAFFLLFSITAISQAQTIKNSPTQPGTVRVAVVNIGVVFSKYERAQSFKKELEVTIEPFKKAANKLTQEMKVWGERIKTGKLGDDEKEELQAAITKNQRVLEDMDKSIKRLLGKKQEGNLVILWKEVQSGIRTYAMEHGIELVFGYGDPMDSETLDLFPNVNRKMQAMDTGSTVPLYMIPRAEIGDAVADMLNRRYREKKAKEPQGKPIDLE